MGKKQQGRAAGTAARAVADSSVSGRPVVPSRHRVWLGLGAALLIVLGTAWLAADRMMSSTPAPAVNAGQGGRPATTPPAFVGSAACAACHPTQHGAWRTSQHARAMQHASAETVLGDFKDAKYTKDGVTSTFFTRDGKYFVRTDGPEGRLADFEVKYTFGVEPLQQYLVELPGGRLQALAVSWDTRSAQDGGQGWFRQYPDEKLDFRDELHWTRAAQNWNGMCADCHSTDVRKGYDDAKDTFDTRSAEISVGCESCHGPGSAHLEWARRKDAADAARGLTVALDERRGAAWRIDAASGNAKRTPERRTGREIEVCAPCHARRAQIAEGWRPGRPLMDHYLPTTLQAGLYHADGQQRDEVFVWASFLQSRMHAAGVTCGDCHDPHTQKLRAPGNAVCAQCHLASKYDSQSHHFHRPETRAAQCVNCHMPQVTYMVVDPRRDHSLRVPRPDLSVTLGTPNACSECHRETTAQWAADAVARWYGAQRRNEPHYGQAIDAGRQSRPGAARGLVALATSVAYPPIVRATAIELLARYPGRTMDDAVRRALGDADPLVRHAAVTAVQAATPEQLLAVLAPLLADPVRAVRIEAARRMAPVAMRLDGTWRASFDKAIAEFEAVQRGNLDRPEGWMNLGNLHLDRGEAAQAEEAYRSALKRDPRFVPAYVNLADLKRSQQRDAEAEAVLREGLRAAPDAAALREALGLTLVRQGRKAPALAELAAARKSAPDASRYAYVYALALHDAGRRADAIRVLAESAKRHGDRDVLLALAMYRSEDGDHAGAQEALKAVEAVNPDDPALAQFRQRR